MLTQKQKKIASITFQNFQKLFIENDMKWTNKNNELIYTIKTSTERDRIEQVTTTNFNQNVYLGKVDRENAFCQLQGRKVYRSLNWVYCYYTSFDHCVSLDDKIPHYSEQIRNGFKREKRKERKLVYTTYEYFKTLTTEEKKAVALVAKGNKLMMRAVPGARFFVLEAIYSKKRIKFFKNATFVAKHDVRLFLGFDFNEKSIHGFRLENEAVHMTIWDFSLPFFRIKGRGLYFDQFRFF